MQGGLCGGRLLLRLIESHVWCGSCTSLAAFLEPPAANAGGSFFGLFGPKRTNQSIQILGPFKLKKTNHTIQIKGDKTLPVL